MIDKVNINSLPYWDAQFSKNWESLKGSEQSRFFAKLAIAHLPNWFIPQLKEEKLTLADWGCAQGDSTEIWSHYLDPKQIVGVDFSSPAIEQAIKRYPGIRFIHENWLANTETQNEVFDVLFSSNALEHFHKPYDALAAISKRAKKSIVLIIPHEEIKPQNIPMLLPNAFGLVWSQMIDCRNFPETSYMGDQIILIYANINWLNTLDLKLTDCCIEQIDLKSEIFSLKSEIANLNQTIDFIFKSKSWQITHPLRFTLYTLRSQWKKLIASPSIIRQKLVHNSRKLYHQIPLPYSFKQPFKRIIKKLFPNIGHLNLPSTHSISRPTISITKQKKSLPDILIFSVIDWDFRIQRPQHIAKIFAEQGHRVFYVSNNFGNKKNPGFYIKRLFSDLRLYSINLGLNGTPSIYEDTPSHHLLSQLKKGLGSFLSWTESNDKLVFVEHPFWTSLAFEIPGSRVIYDCMDNHAGFKGTGSSILEEKKLLEFSHLVLASSKGLYDRILPENSNIALIRNATDYTFFSTPPNELYKTKSPTKIIGYYGAIAEWFDWEIVAALAKNFPNYEILLVGNDSAGVKKKLSSYKNIIFTGEVSYNKLPYYLYAFDVCIIPFKVTPLTLDTNPVKAYEYLSAGKPVVSIDLPELHEFANLVQLAKSKEEFIQQIEIALEMDTPQKVEERKKFASKQTWISRINDFQETLNNLKEPLVSIIVLTYNNLSLTKACLESIDKYTDYKNLEIIVVDNASTDETHDFLEKNYQNRKNYKIIFNAENIGFSAGNNVGLKCAKGDYLVILNNDTRVTPGWLRTMLNHFRRNPKLGLLGPITNNIGNSAKVLTHYENPDDMLPEARNITYNNMGELLTLKTNTIAFFCVMMPREVFESVGLLDEIFGLGFFEDDDYCRRVEKLGYDILCAKDVFVHHHLSASFNKLPTKARQDLFEKNKKAYETKWGKWKPHE